MGDIPTCTKTRLLFAKTAERNSFSPPVNRNSMQKKDLKTSPDVAASAVRQSATLSADPERCSTLFAQSAEHLLRFPSSPRKIVLFTAMLALKLTVHNKQIRNDA